MVQLLFAYLARFVHNLFTDRERIQERRCVPRLHPDEDWCLRRRHNHRLSLAMGWSTTSHLCLSSYLRHPHSRMDPANDRAQLERFRLLHAILRSG